jgi:hypothetical protein
MNTDGAGKAVGFGLFGQTIFWWLVFFRVFSSDLCESVFIRG